MSRHLDGLGAWVLDAADARSLFRPDVSGLWQRVFLILERLEALAAPPRPSAA